MPGARFEEATILDNVRSKIEEVLENEPIKVEIREAPKRNHSSAYISLNPIGVKPKDKIVVVVFKDAILVMKMGVRGQ